MPKTQPSMRTASCCGETWQSRSNRHRSLQCSKASTLISIEACGTNQKQPRHLDAKLFTTPLVLPFDAPRDHSTPVLGNRSTAASVLHCSSSSSYYSEWTRRTRQLRLDHYFYFYFYYYYYFYYYTTTTTTPATAATATMTILLLRPLLLRMHSPPLASSSSYVSDWFVLVLVLMMDVLFSTCQATQGRYCHFCGDSYSF